MARKWRDGKMLEDFPVSAHIGWTVCTAGWIDLDEEPSSTEFNDGRRRVLPPGYRMILKDIDSDGNAITYRHDTGVLKFPAELLQPWDRHYVS